MGVKCGGVRTAGPARVRRGVTGAAAVMEPGGRFPASPQEEDRMLRKSRSRKAERAAQADGDEPLVVQRGSR